MFKLDINKLTEEQLSFLTFDLEGWHSVCPFKKMLEHYVGKYTEVPEKTILRLNQQFVYLNTYQVSIDGRNIEVLIGDVGNNFELYKMMFYKFGYEVSYFEKKDKIYQVLFKPIYPDNLLNRIRRRGLFCIAESENEADDIKKYGIRPKDKTVLFYHTYSNENKVKDSEYKVIIDTNKIPDDLIIIEENDCSVSIYEYIEPKAIDYIEHRVYF